MPDPWAEAAKNYKPTGQGEAAPASNTDYKIWQQPDTAEQGNPGFFGPLQDAYDDAVKPTTGPLQPLAVFGRGVMELAEPVMHPVKTFDAVRPHDRGEVLQDLMSPGSRQLAGMVKGAKDDFRENGPAEAIPHIAGQVAGGFIAGEMPGMAGGLRDFIRPSPPEAIISPEEMAARNVARTVLPPGGIKPEFLKSLQSELPAVKAYAARTGNPLRTQLEGRAASTGVAEEGLGHYREQILKPAQNTAVAFEPGQTELGTRTTLGEIDKRITDLNHMLDTSKAASSGEVLDKVAKSKYEGELGTLRNALYTNLSRESGIPAESIQQLREGYGGQYSLANNIEAAENARLTRTGQRSQGAESINLKPPTLLDLPSRFFTALRGGEQAIADRQFARAMRPIQAQEPMRPGPQPISPQLRPLLESQNKAAADAEFIRSEELGREAQAQADARASRAAQLRESRRATATAGRKLEGEAARTIGREKALKGGK